MYIVVPPISILLFNCVTKTALDVCFQSIIELIIDNSGKHDIITAISWFNLLIKTISDIKVNVIVNLPIRV